jgi:hypothetical protein
MRNARAEAARTGITQRANWLAPAGTAMAMLACYGVSATIGLASLVGVSIALPFRAPVIVFFSAFAAAGLASSFRRHRNRPALILGLLGFVLIVVSKFLPLALRAESFGIEGTGFLCLIAGNILAFRARRVNGLSCDTRPTM